MNHIGKRLLQSFVTVFAVIHFSFSLIHLLPGGPMDYFLGQQLIEGDSDQSYEELAAQAEVFLQLNPSDPIEQQYVDYMSSLLSGQLGQSVWYREPVSDILAKALPWTILIMSVAIFVSFAIAILLGSLMAYKEGSLFDYSFTGITLLSSSIPYYVAAIFLLLFFGYRWSVFPVSGHYSTNVEVGTNLPFVKSVLSHAFLPIMSAILTSLGSALSMRANSIQVLGNDYLRVARLRGLSERRIAFIYVARNAMLPLYTSLMIRIGFLFGGSVILEQIFSYPGIGYYLFQSINTRDYPLMMGGFILITTAVVISIFIADLTYSRLDPRAGQEGGA